MCIPYVLNTSTGISDAALRRESRALKHITRRIGQRVSAQTLMRCDWMYKLRRHVKFTSEWESRIQNDEDGKSFKCQGERHDEKLQE